jgi:signal transduction histidine kinase
MELSQADIQRVAGFIRKVTKASNTETIIADTLQVLKAIAKIEQLRVVYSPVLGRWTEWRSSANGLEVRPHRDRPVPEKNALTAFFDPESKDAGFISTGKKGPKVRQALNAVAPQVWSALLLRSAVERLQKASISETEFTRTTLRARDEERQHIARELHDDLGQSMVSLRLQLKWAEDNLRRRKQRDGVIRELANAREDVGVMLNKIRDLSHTLHPRILDTLGLASALKELVHQVSRFSRIKVRCETQGKPRPVQKETAVALYRCCQEAINNALKHSGASELAVHIHYAKTEIRISVEDNGAGFDPRELYDSNSRMMSSGFWTIRQRMADIGAAFRVSTADGQGTVVELIIPNSRKETNGKGKDKATSRG